MKKGGIYLIAALVLVALLYFLTRSCSDDDIIADKVEIVTIDTTYIENIDTVFTQKYVIITISRDSIFKRTRKTIHGDLKNSDNNDDQENSNEIPKNPDKESGTPAKNPKNPSKSPNTEIEVDTFIETSTTTTIDTFLNLWPPNYDKPEIKWNEPYNPNSVANYNSADKTMVESQYYEYSLDAIAKLEPFVVPIKFHEIFRTNGSGVAINRDHYDILVDNYLNGKFRRANIDFVRCGEINYIKNSELYNFPSLDYEGSTYNFKYLENIMAQYNMPNVLNVYLVESIGGNANGLYPGQESEKHPESMLVIKKDMIMDHVPEHEIGHWLLLRHTHYSNTPNNLTTELVNGTNCKTAGDMLCDTKADPNLSGRVSDNCSYNRDPNLKDSKGQVFNPEVNNFMSYSISKCVKAFSDEQLKRMAVLIRTDLRNFITQENCNRVAPTPVINPEKFQFSDISINDIKITPRSEKDKFDVSIKVTNNGEFSTPRNEGQKLKYFVNSIKSDNEWIVKSLAPGDSVIKNVVVSIASTDSVLEFKVEISKFSNEWNENNNFSTFTKRIPRPIPDDTETGGGETEGNDPDTNTDNNDPIVLTNVSKECPTSTLLDLKKVYSVTLDYAEINSSNQADDGYWFKFYVPKEKMAKTIRIYDVSDNFDPILGVKSNCAYANYIPDDYNEKSDNMLNSNGKGNSETFYNDFYGESTGNNGFYHFKINHVIGGENPKITFKIRIE